jgi:hypothetical protein
MNRGGEAMKKFVMLSYGSLEPTPEGMAAWRSWFASIGDRIVDSGNPLANGVVVTPRGSRPLSSDDDPATGYWIVSAESLEDAARLLDGCPIVESVRVYESVPM